MTSTTTKPTYPFPTEVDDEVFKRFGIESRMYTDGQKEAAAIAWSEFCAKQQDGSLFIKLVGICEGSLAEATVLWDVLRHHRTMRDGLRAWRETAGSYFKLNYGSDFADTRTYNRSIYSLVENNLLVEFPVGSREKRKYRLDWIVLSEQLDQVSTQLPGLNVMLPVASMPSLSVVTSATEGGV
jgi:hypothetical protein